MLAKNKIIYRHRADRTQSPGRHDTRTYIRFWKRIDRVHAVFSLLGFYLFFFLFSLPSDNSPPKRAYVFVHTRRARWPADDKYSLVKCIRLDPGPDDPLFWTWPPHPDGSPIPGRGTKGNRPLDILVTFTLRPRRRGSGACGTTEEISPISCPTAISRFSAFVNPEN